MNYTPGPWGVLLNGGTHVSKCTRTSVKDIADVLSGLADARAIAAVPEMIGLLKETRYTLLVIYHQLWARQMEDWGAQEQADKIDALLKRIEGEEEEAS